MKKKLKSSISKSQPRFTFDFYRPGEVVFGSSPPSGAAAKGVKWWLNKCTGERWTFLKRYKRKGGMWIPSEDWTFRHIHDPSTKNGVLIGRYMGSTPRIPAIPREEKPWVKVWDKYISGLMAEFRKVNKMNQKLPPKKK